MAAQKVALVRSPNHTNAQRPIRSIDRIVIHVAEGSYAGSVRWLANRRSHGSSHFIVSRTGKIAQLVSTSDIAWHAGNWRVNARSIGIEHAGYTYRPGSITEAEYEASARLVAYLTRRMRIPIDRRHIIGHHEVGNPFRPGMRGGIDGHTDPGPFWRWRHYMGLVRKYARDPQPLRYVRMRLPRSAPRVAPRVVRERAIRCGFRASIHSTTVYRGQTLAGLVAWRARPCGRRIHRVDFFVDGKLRWVDRVRPFAFARDRGLNTTSLANGWHTLSMRAHAPRGHRVRKRLRIRVENQRFAVRFEGVAPQQSLRGKVRLEARPNAAAWVALLVDGRVVRKGSPAPHGFTWDTSAVENGTHRVELQAEALDGRRARAEIPVVVLNGEPSPELAAHVDWQSLLPWQTVAGPVVWEALASGTVKQVEFWIDGRLRSVDLNAPYVFGPDDGVWDASAEEPGAHRLTVKAVGAHGHASEQTVTVFAGS
jgi:N-acetyl-anhydromuramyl-L-alanine amidase AmpD